MGWTFTSGATRADVIRVQTKGFVNDSGKLACIAKCCTGNNLWAVFERTVKERTEDGTVTPARTYRFICLFMLSNHRSYGWGYKDVDESMGPTYYNCPLKYIEMAEAMPMPAVEMHYAAEWRQAVRNHWQRQSQVRENAAGLKPGDKFWSLAMGKEYTFVENHSANYVIGRTGFTSYRIKKANISLVPPVPMETPVQ